MVEPKVALRELRTLGSQFKSSIDSVGKMGGMTNCVTTHQFDRDRAESRAPPADRRTRRTSGAKAMEQTGYQESKKLFWNNQQLFGPREGAGAVELMLELVQEMDTNRSFNLERPHQTLGPPKPNQNRAGLIQFLEFPHKQQNITLEGSRLFFTHDSSAETIWQRCEFNAIKKTFSGKGTFWGFHLRRVDQDTTRL